MNRLRDEGFFEITLDEPAPALSVDRHVTHDGAEETFDDPYRFGPLLTDFDLYLHSEGRHFTSYDKLGAHLVEVDGVKGVHFAVWAPNAYRVSVIGEFNGWDVRVHPMRRHIDAGIWELFIPGLDEWTLYKYDLRSQVNGYRTQKTDPYGFCDEMRPRTASMVVDLDRYEWGDGDVDGSAPAAQRPARADVDLRGASRIVAAQNRRLGMADLPRDRGSRWFRMSKTWVIRTSS